MGIARICDDLLQEYETAVWEMNYIGNAFNDAVTAEESATTITGLYNEFVATEEYATEVYNAWCDNSCDEEGSGGSGQPML